MSFPLATLSFQEPGSTGIATRTFSSTTELAETLQHLYFAFPNAPPLLAKLTRANLDSLLIGLGRPYLSTGAPESGSRAAADLSCLAFNTHNGEPPYFSARTEPAGPHALVWFLDGSWTEFPPDTGLPLETAIEAALQFVSASGLPPAVRWEED